MWTYHKGNFLKDKEPKFAKRAQKLQKLENLKLSLQNQTKGRI